MTRSIIALHCISSVGTISYHCYTQVGPIEENSGSQTIVHIIQLQLYYLWMHFNRQHLFLNAILLLVYDTKFYIMLITRFSRLNEISLCKEVKYYYD